MTRLFRWLKLTFARFWRGTKMLVIGHNPTAAEARARAEADLDETMRKMRQASLAVSREFKLDMRRPQSKIFS